MPNLLLEFSLCYDSMHFLRWPIAPARLRPLNHWPNHTLKSHGAQAIQPPSCWAVQHSSPCGNLSQSLKIITSFESS
ncbi:hypothetical protein JAAARDRAFT_394341 [Jaapia argillacea MUCL 33604]|uniref:Uncharacterized protein n=1 Tax=Jaapia argillacea MUCL 33604 TaxID=933084 RepID=A0A067PVU5_9AGAM|nr:hypothetical protein JAAARDRAFT_394341 [Jaapia argillacea MUCL 33604]